MFLNEKLFFIEYNIMIFMFNIDQAFIRQHSYGCLYAVYQHMFMKTKD